jgi:hypothetical protein
MPEITFPLSSSPGRGKQESGGRLINSFTEQLSPTARAKTVRRRVPGITQLTATSSYSHLRGFHESSDVVYAALDERLMKVTLSGSTYSITDLGSLSGDTPVTFAQNNSDTPDKVVVTEDGAFNVFADSAPTAFAAPALPQPNSVTAIGGYLVFTTLFGEIWATGLNVLTIATDSFATAQQKSDSLLRGITFRGEFLACGKASIEVYTNAGTAPFPLAYSTTIPRGLRGPWAIAGYQDGWANELIWVADDNTVQKLDGYRAVRVSTHDVERDIAAITDEDDLEAYVYMHGGHAIWSLSSSSWTWEFNLTTGQWNERESYQEARWRASQSVNAFGLWMVGDRESGKIGKIDPDAFTEFSDPLIWTVESAPGSVFPGRVSIPRADFDFEVGIGSVTGTEPIQTDPQVNISWSDNGGATFSSPVRRSLGRQAKWQTLVNVNRTGMAGSKGRLWRLEVSDPVRVSLYSGSMVAEGRTV